LHILQVRKFIFRRVPTLPLKER